MLSLVVFLGLGGCSTLGLGGDKTAGQSGTQSGGTSMVQEIMDLEAALASERKRADKAEDEARRAGEEADWLSEAAQGVPAMQARIAGLQGQVTALQQGNVEAIEKITALSNEIMRLEQAAEMREAMAAEAEAEALAQQGSEPAIAASDTSGSSASSGTAGTGPTDAADDTRVYGLHVASYRSPDELARGWDYFRTTHPDILGELSAKSVLFDVPTLGGVYYRLIVGPVTGQRSAQTMCDALSARAEYCVVSEFDLDSADIE